MLKEIETFIPEFEDAIELQGATTRIGERLHEAVHAGRTTIERHLTNQYFSEFEIKSDTAHILIIKKLPLELSAPIYVKEREELAARRMQRLALNAFLKAYYEHDPDWYVLLGVPLFLPPHSEVVEWIKRMTKRDVDFKSGFLSTYRKIVDEYAGAIATSEERIYEDARSYLQSA